MQFYLAIDIGASSGRHIVGWREDGTVQTKEVYRFPNGVCEENGHLVWDIRKLFIHVVSGILEAFHQFREIESLSIDTWGVDYVLLKEDIFSVKEGEQKFESHTDSLINYIRYWQSEGESKKTSIRIKTRLDQLRAEGLYTGGPVRYGYRAVEKGRMNKKNKPVKDLEINPSEAAVVREIFERTVYQGEGSFTLANDLNARGYRTRQGAKFQSMTINRILKDRQYLGYLVTKDVTSPHLPDLQIIDEDTFRMAGEIVRQRKAVNAEWRSIPRQSGNGALLAGNLYCAHCGSRMTSSCPGEGAKRLRAEYICYKGANRRIQCNGQRAYVAEKVDAVVLEVTQELMNMISTIPKDDALEKQMKAQIIAIQQIIANSRRNGTSLHSPAE